MADSPKEKFRRSCFAASLGGCDAISQEHVISAGVASVLGKANMKLAMPNGRVILSESAKPRILCKHHNAALSPFDYEAQRMFAAVAEYHQGPREQLLVSRGSPLELRVAVNGWNLERWMLKTFLNRVIFSAATRDASNRLCHAWGENLIDYLFRGKPLPVPWGIYGFPVTKNYDAGCTLPNGQVFALVIQELDTKVIKNVHLAHVPGASWVEEFETPMWQYVRFFGMDLALVGNVSSVPDMQWLHMLRSTNNNAIGEA